MQTLSESKIEVTSNSTDIEKLNPKPDDVDRVFAEWLVGLGEQEKQDLSAPNASRLNESLSGIDEMILVDEMLSAHPTRPLRASSDEGKPFNLAEEVGSFLKDYRQSRNHGYQKKQFELSKNSRQQESENSLKVDDFEMLLNVLKFRDNSVVINRIAGLTNLTFIQRGLDYVNQELGKKLGSKDTIFKLNRQKKLFEAKLKGMDIQKLCATHKGKREIFGEWMERPTSNKTQPVKSKNEDQSSSRESKPASIDENPIIIIDDSSEEDRVLLVKENRLQPTKRKAEDQTEDQNSGRDSKRPRKEPSMTPFDDILLSTFLSEFLTKASINQGSNVVEDRYSPMIIDDSTEIIEIGNINMHSVVSIDDQMDRIEISQESQTERKDSVIPSVRSTRQFQFLKPPSHSIDLTGAAHPMDEKNNMPGSNL